MDGGATTLRRRNRTLRAIESCSSCAYPDIKVVEMPRHGDALNYSPAIIEHAACRTTPRRAIQFGGNRLRATSESTPSCLTLYLTSG